MELALVIYLIDLLATFTAKNVLGLITAGLIATFILCVLKVISFDSKAQDHEIINGIRPTVAKFLGASAVLIVVAFLSPSKETSYAMLAAYGVQTVAESEQVQEVAGKSLKVLEKYMDDYLEQTPEKSED